MTQSLNFIDYFILIIMTISIIFGFINGFVRSILSVIVWIAAFFISAFYGPHLATTFSLVTNDPQWQLWLSYGSVFITAVLIGFVVRLILNLILTGGEVGILNRFGGAIFGFARGILIILLFTWFAFLVGMNQTAAFQSSQIMPFFDNLLTSVENIFPSINQIAQNALNSMNTNTQVQSATQLVNQGKQLINEAPVTLPHNLSQQ